MKTEGKEKNSSIKRICSMAAIVLLFMAGIAFLIYKSELLLDEMIALILVQTVFLIVFLITLMKKRLICELPAGDSTSYRRICVTLFICWTVVILFEYIPEYFAPIMLLSVLLTTVLDDATALALSFYYIIVLCITGGLSSNVMYCYCLLAVLGILLTAFLKNQTRAEALGIYIIYFLINILIPVIFYYIAYLELTKKAFFFAVANGLLNSLLIMICYTPLKERAKEETAYRYLELMEDDYVLLQDFKRFSLAEFHHAKRVSKLAAFCAKEIGADVDCTACAGLYYRIGKMLGEPEIDNALTLANHHCFPKPVMDIMEEYGGVLRLPQTPESAIVHMVDALVTKIELLDADTMSSTWNQDMVIYQTLNELSQKGFYDESKMSINQFLKIREKLVQEDSLL